MINHGTLTASPLAKEETHVTEAEVKESERQESEAPISPGSGTMDACALPCRTSDHSVASRRLDRRQEAHQEQAMLLYHVRERGGRR